VSGFAQLVNPGERKTADNTPVARIEPEQGWSGAAAESAAVRTRLKYLAYDLITALQGSRPSNQDYRAALDMLAANSGSPTQMKSAIKNMTQLAARNFANRYRTLTDQEFNWEQELKERDLTFPGLYEPHRGERSGAGQGRGQASRRVPRPPASEVPEGWKFDGYTPQGLPRYRTNEGEVRIWDPED
jgi:hypothetical protein